MKPACEGAQQFTYTRDGKAFEGFYLNGQLAFENQIINDRSHTRTDPGWVLRDNHFCAWQGQPPPRIAGLQQLPSTIGQATPVATQQQVPTTQQNLAPAGGDTGGAFLLVLCIIGAAGYALYEQKFGRSDEERAAENYHPMADVPALPTVYTDEHLDHVYQRYQHPTNQGIDTPNPWSMQPVYPRSQPPPPPPYPTTPPPDTTDIPPVDTTENSTSGMQPVEPKQHFELTWLPAPSRGYFLDEESVLSSSSQARRIVRDAVAAGVSTNFLMAHVFKISKNTKKHELLKELVDSVSRELG